MCLYSLGNNSHIYGLVLLNVVFALYLYYVFLSDLLYGKNTNTEE